MIPLNLDTYTFTVFGNVTVPVYTPTAGELNIIYSVAMQQEKDLSDTIIYCGSDIVATNYGKDYPQVITYYDCGQNPITIQKTGNDEAHVIIQLLQEAPKYYGIGTTSPSNISPDGVLISFFLFLGLIFGLIYFLVKSLGYIEIRRKYTGNNTIEGKEEIEF